MSIYIYIYKYIYIYTLPARRGYVPGHKYRWGGGDNTRGGGTGVKPNPTLLYILSVYISIYISTSGRPPGEGEIPRRASTLYRYIHLYRSISFYRVNPIDR